MGRIHTCPVPLPLFAGDEELPYVFVAGNQVGPLGSCCSSLVPAKSPPSPPCLNCQPPAIVAGQTVPICPPAYSTEPSHPAFLHVNLQGIPRWGPRLAGLHDAFCQAFKAASPDFQVGLAFGLGQRSGVPSGRAGLAVFNSVPALMCGCGSRHATPHSLVAVLCGPSTATRRRCPTAATPACPNRRPCTACAFSCHRPSTATRLRRPTPPTCHSAARRLARSSTAWPSHWRCPLCVRWAGLGFLVQLHSLAALVLLASRHVPSL